jgi:hypothetical protein
MYMPLGHSVNCLLIYGASYCWTFRKKKKTIVNLLLRIHGDERRYPRCHPAHGWFGPGCSEGLVAERHRQPSDPQLPSRWPGDGDGASGRRWRGPFPSPSTVRASQPSSPSPVMAPHPIKSEVRFFPSRNRVENDGFYIGRELLKFRLKVGESWLHACAS